jgi:hypothetical protein
MTDRCKVLVIVVEFACVAKLIQEYRLDGTMTRFALVCVSAASDL